MVAPDWKAVRAPSPRPLGELLSLSSPSAAGHRYVFLSNTGSKCSEECRKKLQSPPYQLDPQPLPHDTIYTTAEAQIAYLQENVPRGSKLFVVSGETP